MIMIAALKWVAIVGVIFLIGGVFFGAAATKERGDALGNMFGLMILCFCIFFVAVVVWLILAAVHWWPA